MKRSKSVGSGSTGPLRGSGGAGSAGGGSTPVTTGGANQRASDRVDLAPEAAPPTRGTNSQGSGGTAKTTPAAEAAGAAGAAETAAQQNKGPKADPTGPDAPETRDKTAAQWIMDNPGKTAAGIAASAIAADALLRAKKSGETVRTIIKVEPAETGEFFANKKRVKITYTPDIAIVPKDNITISGSRTTPSIDGSTSVPKSDIVSDGSIIITASAEITNFTEGGTITVSTGFMNQASSITGQTAGAVGSAVGEGAGAVAGGLGEGLGATVGGLFEGLGIWAWIGIGVLILFLFMR